MSIKLNESIAEVILLKYVEINGRKFYVDNKRVVIDPSKKELYMALWLSKKLGKRIEILPRVLIPERIKTSDYLIDGSNWDLKTISSNRNNAIYTSIRIRQEQSNNFIFDISNSKLTIKAVLKQMDGIYSMKGFNWVNDVIIKKNNTLEIIRRK